MKIGDIVNVRDPDNSEDERMYEGEILDISEEYGATVVLVGYETDYYKVREFDPEDIRE